MIAFPNAKINLGLNIVEKRKDGFHNLETVFYPINLCDVLEIVKSADDKPFFNTSGLAIPGNGASNLCLKAFHLLKQDFDLPEVKMHLHKVIPMGAGLGGGSSNAAQALILLNELFELKLTQDQLLSYARKLGADCAFFILNKPVFATERGDIFKEIDLSLKGYQIIIVKTNIHVKTAEAFTDVKVSPVDHSLINEIQIPVSNWKKIIKNDFEENIFKKYPVIEVIRNTLYQKGAVYASMSGSGSSVYGLFDRPVDLSKDFKGNFYFSSIF